MKPDKRSVEGQLDIFAAMNRATEVVDRMVEQKQVRVFENSKDAVDYYIGQLEQIRTGEMTKAADENEPFRDMCCIAEGIYAECE